MTKKKKLWIAGIATALVIILTVTLLLVFLLKPEEEPEDGDYGDGDDLPMTASDGVNMILDAMSKQLGSDNIIVGTDLSFKLSDGTSSYILTIKGNFIKTDEELAIVLSEENGGKRVLAFYIVNGKVYIEISDKKIYMKDFDLSSIIAKIGEKYNIQDLINNGLTGDATRNLLDTVLSMAGGDIKYTKDGTREDISIELGVYDLLKMALDIVHNTGVEGLLESFSITLPEFIKLQHLIDNLNVPAFKTFLTAVIKDGSLDTLDILVDGGTEFNFDFGTILKFSSEKINLDLPADLINYSPFSLTNLQFNGDVSLNGTSFDVARLVNLIAGSKLMPLDTVILNSNIKMNMKVQVDLSIEDNMKNMIFIEIYKGSTQTERLAGIYFIDGVLKVNVNGLLPGGIKAPNLRFENINITQELKKIVDSVVGVIDSALMPAEGALSKAFAASADYSGTIATVEFKNTTKGILAPDFVAFLNVLTKTTSFDQNILITESQVSVVLNQKFFDVLKQISPSIVVDWQFGDLRVDFNLFDYGIKNIAINMKETVNNPALSFEVRDILFGFVPEDIEENILASTNGVAFTSNVSEMIFDALKGVELSGQTELKFKRGTYSISDLLSLLDVNIPDLNMTFEKDFDLQAEIKFQMSLDTVNTANSKIFFEIIATQDFAYGKAGKLIGIYHTDNKFYIDLSGIVIAGIRMPQLSFDLDITTMLKTEIDKIDASSIFGTEKSKLANGGSAQTNSVLDTTIGEMLDKIIVGINMDSFSLKATSVAIENLLAHFAINVKLPTIDIAAEITGRGTANLSIKSGQSFEFALNLNKIIVGDDVEIALAIDPTDYEINLFDVILEKISSLRTSGNVTLSTKESSIDIQQFINGLLAGANVRIDMPINLNMFDSTHEYKIAMSWYFDMENPYDTQLKFELRTGSDDFVMGVYLKDDILYCDLTKMGFGKFSVDHVGIGYAIEKEMAKLRDTSGMSWNLSDLIDSLINPPALPPIEDDGFTDEEGNGGSEETTKSLVDYIVEGLGITDSTITMKLTSEVVTAIMKMYGIAFDYALDAEFDIDYVANTIGADINFEKLNLVASLTLENIGGYEKVDFGTMVFEKYVAFDASTAESLITTVLNGLEPKLWVDVTTYNTDSNGEKTRIGIEKMKERGSTSNGMSYKKGDFLISVYDGHSTATPWLYAKLDSEYNMDGSVGGHIWVKGTAEWFTVMVLGLVKAADGTAINMGFDMDIKGMISGMFPPAVVEIEDEAQGNGIDATSKLATASEGVTQETDILAYLNGVTLTILPTDQIKIGVDINGRAVSKMIVETLNGLFSGMVTDTGNPIVYNDTDAGKFFESLKDNVLFPMVKPMVDEEIKKVPSWQQGLANATTITNEICSAIHKLVRRFLPLPKFTDMSLEMNILQGQVANILVVGTDNDSTTSPKRSLTIDIYNMMADDVIDWGVQNRNIIYDPYSNRTLQSYFSTSAKKMLASNTSNAYTTESIVWDINTAIAKDEAGKFIPGVYTVTGSAFGKSVSVSVTILEEKEIESIAQIKASPYAKLPNEVVLNFTDGTSRVAGGVTINAPATGFAAHNIETTVTLSNGQVYPVVVAYRDATITSAADLPEINFDLTQFAKDGIALPSRAVFKFADGSTQRFDVVFDISDIVDNFAFDKTEYTIKAIINQGLATEQTLSIAAKADTKAIKNLIMDGRYNSFILDQYDYKLNTDAALPKVVVAEYIDGKTEEINVTWDLSKVAMTIDGGRYMAIATFTAGTRSWTREVAVEVPYRHAIGLDNEGSNIMYINPFEYYANGHDSIFKDTMDVKFADGTIHSLPVTWDLGMFSMSFEGGFYNVIAKINIDGLQQSINVPVYIQASQVAGVVLDGDKYVINPMDALYDNKNVFSQQMTMLFTNGNKTLMNVEWDSSNVVIDLVGGEYTATVYVGTGTNRVGVNVAVQVLNMQMDALQQPTMTISYAEYRDAVGQGFFAETAKVVAKDGQVLDLAITWDIENLFVTEDGGVYTVYAIVGSGVSAQRLAMTVTVTA